MENLVALYAAIITVVLFFQGLEINHWYSEVVRLKRTRRVDETVIATDKRVAQSYCEEVEHFLASTPSFIAWIYTVVQVVLIVTAVFYLVPNAYATHLKSGELPFIVLLMVCVFLYPTISFIQRLRFNQEINQLKVKHGIK